MSRVLVLATVPLEEAHLRRAAPELWQGDAPAVRVVAPASDLSLAAWLASDEDAARGKAAETARRTAASVPAGRVETEVVAVPPEQEASWLERTRAKGFHRLGVPVRTLVVHADRPA